MMQITIAKPKDVEVIISLAHHIWNDYYPSIIGQTQVNYMLGLMYTKDSLTEQMIHKNQSFYLISLEDNPVGFFSISTLDQKEFQLHKLYILPNQSKNGLGSKVINWITENINPKIVTITVNRLNIKAINFYFKNGFTILKAENFDIGNGFEMNDFVMTKTI